VASTLVDFDFPFANGVGSNYIEVLTLPHTQKIFGDFSVLWR